MRSKPGLYLWRLGCFLAVQREQKVAFWRGRTFPTWHVRILGVTYKEDGQDSGWDSDSEDPRNQLCSAETVHEQRRQANSDPYNTINNLELHRAAGGASKNAGLLFPWIFITATPGLTQAIKRHPPRGRT